MSIFLTTILLSTDGSPDVALALETAVDLANTTNSELHVVTAARGYPAYDIRIEEVAEQLRQEASETRSSLRLLPRLPLHSAFFVYMAVGLLDDVPGYLSAAYAECYRRRQRHRS